MSLETIAAKARLARAVTYGRTHGHVNGVVRIADVELLLASATDTSPATIPHAEHRDAAPSASPPSDREHAAPELARDLQEYSIPPECARGKA